MHSGVLARSAQLISHAARSAQIGTRWRVSRLEHASAERWLETAFGANRDVVSRKQKAVTTHQACLRRSLVGPRRLFGKCRLLKEGHRRRVGWAEPFLEERAEAFRAGRSR